MALKFETRAMNSGSETSGERKRNNAHRTNAMKSISVIGVMDVSQTKGKRKATVYIGETADGYLMSTTPRGLKPFSSKRALEAAFKQAEAEIKAMKKPFSELAQLTTA